MKQVLSHSHNSLLRSAASVAIVAALSVAVPASAASTKVAQHKNVAATTSSSKIVGKSSHTDRVEARIADLRSKLKITPDQEDKWNNVTQVMRENAQKLDSLTQTRIQNTNKMTAIEDLNSYSQIADAHAEGLKKFIPAFQALYDSMPDAQKKQADAMFQPGQGRMANRMATGKSRS
jgi:hypothetical protein